VSNALHGSVLQSYMKYCCMCMQLMLRFYLEGDRKDNFRATVQWYSWMIELPRSQQKNATSYKEVFLNKKNYVNEIDLETILKTHTVT